MQGFNMGRYVPPDLEGTTSGNALHRKKPPGQRVRASDGTIQQTVRFEMPFAVWCDTCSTKTAPTIIGQGVRFNATKTRAGNYLSTPVWSFRMRHAVCGGELEVRTDPKNTAYVVASGGTRRDTGDDNGPNAARDATGLISTDGSSGLRILTDKERAEMRASAFKQLERTIEDREQAAQTRLRIDEIEAAQATSWDDPYAANAKLRREFRVGRHDREKAGKAAEDLKDRMSLGIDLLPESELDARRAALVDFRPATDSGDGAEDGRKALTKPLFAAGTSASGARLSGNNTPDRGSSASKPLSAAKKTHGSRKKPSRRLKSEIAAAQHKDTLVSEIVGNTRASKDPFLVAFGSAASPAEPRARVLAGIKRKQSSGNLEGAVKDAPDPSAPGLKVAKTTNRERDVNEEGGESDVKANTGAAMSNKPSLPLVAALVEYDSD